MEGAAKGSVRGLLRFEGLALFVIATGAYFLISGQPWWLYVVLFLAPDLSMIAYAVNKRTGVIVYNAMHTTIGPLILLAIAVVLGLGWPGAVAAIWFAHIGIDRAVGYGLRYPQSYELTHLGPVGALKKAGGG